MDDTYSPTGGHLDFLEALNVSPSGRLECVEHCSRAHLLSAFKKLENRYCPMHTFVGGKVVASASKGAGNGKYVEIVTKTPSGFRLPYGFFEGEVRRCKGKFGVTYEFANVSAHDVGDIMKKKHCNDNSMPMSGVMMDTDTVIYCKENDCRRKIFFCGATEQNVKSVRPNEKFAIAPLSEEGLESGFRYLEEDATKEFAASRWQRAIFGLFFDGYRLCKEDEKYVTTEIDDATEPHMWSIKNETIKKLRMVCKPIMVILLPD